jgi:hypothetical protein
MDDRNGHHGLWIQQSTNVLMTRFSVNFRWFHDLSLAIFSESCVFANGAGADINIDSHRGGARRGCRVAACAACDACGFRRGV